MTDKPASQGANAAARAPAAAQRTMILLIGGRQLPTFFAIRAWRPVHVLPIHTPEAEGTYLSARAALATAFPHVTWAEPMVIAGDDHIGVWQALRTAIVDGAGRNDEMAVHITGAPQLWTIGATRACVDVGAQHVDLLHIDTRAGQVIHPLRDRRDAGESFKMRCAEYLKFYGATLQTQTTLPSSDETSVARWIGANTRAHRSALAISRRSGQGDAESRVTNYRPSGLPSDVRSALRRIAARHVVNFLYGGWLEIFVYDALANALHQGKPLFDDILFDPKYAISGATRNLDLFATRGGIAAAIECKTGASAEDHGAVTQLAGATQTVGDRFVHKFVVIDHTENEVPGVLAAGRAQRTVIVGADRLAQLPEIVAQEFDLLSGRPPQFPPL